jgi:excisionase family DNA binding protein
MARLLTADEVAEQIRMTTDWIYSQTRQGRFPAVRCGRFYRYRTEDVEAWIAANIVGALPKEDRR